MYCSKCGKELQRNVKFCTNCGETVSTAVKEKPQKINGERSQRETVYEGKIHKCPNCGEVIEAFSDDCPSCGYKFRDRSASSSVKELTDKLERISNEPKISSIFKSDDRQQRQASLIRNFIIPNTYEDLWEFLIHASSQFTDSNEGLITDAWKAKFEQAYQKALLIIDDPNELERVNQLYISTNKKIKKNKLKEMSPILFSAAIVFFSMFIMLISGIDINSDQDIDARNIYDENERLNAIVQEVYDNIDSEKYTLARAKAITLSFNYSSDLSKKDDEAKEQWDETRERLLELIDNAEKESKK